MPPVSINISAPKAANYTPLSPYTTDDNALANNLLCPRYADADSASSPPSPASIESFDIQDSVAWRKGHILYGSGQGKARACNLWAKKRSQILAILFLFMLLGVGCSLGGFFAVRHERGRTRQLCFDRSGGERCVEKAWAKCVSVNGLGYCEGIMGGKEQ